jgi:hypothetical protein
MMIHMYPTNKSGVNHFLCSLPVYWWDTCGLSFPVFTSVYWWDTCGSSFPVFTPGLLVGYMWIIISCVHPVFICGIHVDHHFLCSPRFIGEIHVDHHFLCSPPVYWWDTDGSSFPVFTPVFIGGKHVDHHFLCSPRFIGGIHVDHHFLCSPPFYWLMIHMYPTNKPGVNTGNDDPHVSHQ